MTRLEVGRRDFKILTDKPMEKRLLGGTRHRWENNIGMDIKEIGINTRNLVYSAQDKEFWRVLVNETSGI